MNTKSFPKIIYPNYFNSVIDKKVTLNEIYPNLRKPTTPDKPKEEDYLLRGILLFLGLSFLLLIFYTIFIGPIFALSGLEDTPVWKKYHLLIQLLPPLLVALFLSLRLISVYRKAERSKIEEYFRKLEYNKRELKDYNYKESQLTNPEIILPFRKRKLLNEIEKSRDIVFKRADILVNERKQSLDVKSSVGFFNDYLCRYTKYSNYKNIKISSYSTDIVILDNSSGLFINIEIDEPYDLKTKKPTHYDDIDDRRNEALRVLGFLIIRFTENQVVNYPEYCVYIIGEVIKSILSLLIIKLTEIDYLVDHSEPAWSYEDGFNLAYKNSRADIQERILEQREEYLT